MKKYITPEVELINLLSTDVIQTSSDDNIGEVSGNLHDAVVKNPYSLSNTDILGL